MGKFKNIAFSAFLALSLLFVAGSFSSCSKSYPCPGNGQSSAADLSLFDEDGNPISSGKKRKKNNGLVNKKAPKKIRRKTNLRLE